MIEAEEIEWVHILDSVLKSEKVCRNIELLVLAFRCRQSRVASHVRGETRLSDTPRGA